MTKELFAIIVIAAVIVIAALAWLGSRARRRGQADIAPPAAPPSSFDSKVDTGAFYVSTTTHGDPYDRVAVHGLGFRARARVHVGHDGVVLDMPEREVFIPAGDIRSCTRATWTIDRVVESDGLVRIEWRLGDRLLDTNLRFVGDDREVFAAIDEIANQEGASA